MFQDEARFGRISQTRYCWCQKPLRPLTQAMMTQQYTYAAVSPADGVLDTLILPSVNYACMQVFLDEVARRHPDENILMVVDGAGGLQSGQHPAGQSSVVVFTAVCAGVKPGRISLGRSAREVLP